MQQQNPTIINNIVFTCLRISLVVESFLVDKNYALCSVGGFFFRFRFDSVSVSPYTSAKPEFRLVMLVGSCTAWNTEFSLMARCQAIKLLAGETIPLTRSLAKPERGNTFLEPCSSIWSQPLSVSIKLSCHSWNALPRENEYYL